VQFRIRSDSRDVGSRTEHSGSNEQYLEHLKKFDRPRCDDLWKFFYRDFFHDGDIESLEVNLKQREVVMKLACPNFQYVSDGEPDEYVLESMQFTCTFSGVVDFTIHDNVIEDGPGEDDDWRWNKSLEFLYSEINASPILKAPTVEDYDSILMKFCTDTTIVYLEIVFDGLSVVPAEPMAFLLMEKDPGFHVPTHKWELDEEGSGDVE